MSGPVFFHLGDGEYIGTHGLRVSFRDIFGNEAELTLPDGRIFRGNWRECKRAANDYAQEATQ